MSGRECSFAFQAPPKEPSTPGASSHKRSISPGQGHSQGFIALPNFVPLSASSNTESVEQPSINNLQDPALDEAVNLNHMELLSHSILDKEMFNLGAGFGDFFSNISLSLKTGLESPYLLHQQLAFSARHLAFIHPERSAFYLHQAITLQTRAVSLFNVSWTEVNRSNCVQILLFSVVLGHHLFADTLAKRDGLDAFMTHYVQCVGMHRGIHAIASTAWPLLMESELEPVLSWTSKFNSRPPRGNHCQRIRELVDGADGLGDKEKGVCRLAIQYLQVGFDSVLAEEAQGNRYQMILTWSILVPPEFTKLLAAKRPEALALLGYYTVLLHFSRNMWQVGDAGPYILNLIVGYLGPAWDPWLEYPREMLSKASITNEYING